MKETNKWICVVAYIIFFVPLLIDNENESYKFHSNQGLVLFILSIAISFVGAMIPIIGWFIILPLGQLLCIILAILGMVNAFQESKKELPIVGKISIIK